MPQNLSSGTYRLKNSLAYQLSFLLTQMSPQKIKNPASSAGHSRHQMATLRETRQELPGVARKVPHSRILRLPYRSDRDSPDWHRHYGKCPNREPVYPKPEIRQVLVKNIFAKISSGLWMAQSALSFGQLAAISF